MRIIQFWERGESGDPILFAYAAGASAAMFMISLLNEQNFFRSISAGLETKSMFASILFDKLLRVRNTEGFSSGYLINLASNDTQKFENMSVFLHFLLIGPLELCGCLAYLGLFLGWQASIAAVVSLFLLTSLQFLLSKSTGAAKERSLTYNDKVATTVSDVIGGIGAVKYYGWESVFLKKILSYRSKRLSQLRIASMLKGTNESIFFVYPFLICGAVIITISLCGLHLDISAIFSSIGLLVFVCLTIAYFAPMAVEHTYEAIVAARRIQEFINRSDRFDSCCSPEGSEFSISLHNATISHNFEAPPETSMKRTPSGSENVVHSDSSSSFKMKIKCLEIKKGSFCCVTGTLGAGKSSLLATILGDMKLEQGDVFVGGLISYASQVPWIIGATVMDNIVLWRPFDLNRYQVAVQASGLLRDIRGFVQGDQTVIYDGGTNLSGGQRARLSLARALYAESDIYLLDDVLSALDNIVASEVYSNIRCVLQGKTIVLVTHQLEFLGSQDRVIVLESGEIAYDGPLSEIESPDSIFQNSAKYTQKSGNYASLPMGSPSSDVGNSVDALTPRTNEASKENINSGEISWKIYSRFLSGMGYVPVVALCFLNCIIAQIAMTAADRWLAYWSSLDRESQKNTDYLAIYGGLIAAAVVLTISRAIFYYLIALRSCQKLFTEMISKILYSPLNFFQLNPAGRIMNRVTKDQALIDELLTWVSFDSFQCSLLITAALIITGVCTLILTVANPLALVSLLFVVPLALYFRMKYAKTAREIKRIEGALRSPLFNMFSSSINGLNIIRTAKVQEIFLNKFIGMADDCTRCNYSFNGCARWLSVRVNFLTDALFSFTALACVVFHKQVDAQQVALALAYSMQLSGLTQWCLRQISEVANYMTCVERIIEYGELPVEGSKECHPIHLPDKWPTQGQIDFENLCLSIKGKQILRDITLSIMPRQRVALVGRTGAGKSSLISALFRIVYPFASGRIMIDSIDISQAPLEELRARVSMIPQEPYIFEQSLRFNLDPFGEFSDKEIWDALAEVNLDTCRFPQRLETPLSNEANMSCGEKQLICLARAILRKSKVLVMDEATANIDPETTQHIQDTISRIFSDSTIITVAHRISTIIDYDKIVVLDQGEVVEVGSGWELLNDDSSYFKKLVDEMGYEGSMEMRRRAEQVHIGSE